MKDKPKRRIDVTEKITKAAEVPDKLKEIKKMMEEKKGVKL